jgi:hypothetical protein
LYLYLRVILVELNRSCRSQVFEILIYYNESKDWTLAMEKVMPQRKFNVVGKRKQMKLKEAEGEGGEESAEEVNIGGVEGSRDLTDEEAEMNT